MDAWTPKDGWGTVGMMMMQAGRGSNTGAVEQNVQTSSHLSNPVVGPKENPGHYFKSPGKLRFTSFFQKFLK